MHIHEHFEELCALAAAGQASMDELEELKGHLPSCAGCRELLGDFGQIAAQALPNAGERHAPLTVPRGMTERFIAHARSEGLPLTNHSIAVGRPSQWNRGAIAWRTLAAFAALIIFTIGLVAGRISMHGNGQQHGGGTTATPSTISERKIVDAYGSTVSENLQVRRQVDFEQAERRTVSSKLVVAQKNLDSAERDRANLAARLGRSETEVSELRTKDAKQEIEIAQLSDGVTQLCSERDAERIAALVEENDLKHLRDTVQRQAAELNDQHQLTAAASQARDLIVARNLHIVDVHDADENGKGQRAFGRIFYTEGKSLVFYAYDLADARKLNAKISFYVWGEKLGTTRPVKNLGIFHSDDANDGRWILTFDDSRVLSEINSVFVTVENKMAVTEPSGKKILYAFLGNKANHP